MTKTRFISALLAGLLAMALFAAVASAQGVTVVSGKVTIAGAAAPAGKTVTISLGDGTVIGQGRTGDSALGLAVNQYRIDVQANPAWEGKTASVTVDGVAQPVGASFVFTANRAFTLDVTGTVAAPTATPAPKPTSTPDPSLRGPAGPAGSNGSTGATGPAGKDGAPGAIGPVGPAGKAGAIGPVGPAGKAGGGGTAILGAILGAVGIALGGYGLMKAKGKKG